MTKCIYKGRQEGFSRPEDGDMFTINFDIERFGKIEHVKDSTLLRLTLARHGIKLPLKPKKDKVYVLES